MSGLPCPTCDTQDSAIIDTQNVDLGKRRRRQCCSCGHKWATLEVPIGRMPRDINSLFAELGDGHVADAVMALGAKRAYAIATQLLLRIGLEVEFPE